jgi:phosphoribosylformylglycinamidine cyclo-ligase
MAHITGGGITDNLPRILPVGTAASVHKGSWPVLPIFNYIREKGSVDDSEMYHTFNMGIGMILVVSPEDVEAVQKHFRAIDEPCYEIGEIIAGDGKVHYTPS